ncbi:CRYB [Mytilus edulis]|uniref:CRYB n=1 Tax=Mytilus edulis TaxID=6550 RepID=A0A8S3QFD7_MYTED|nr:CRYB [Mytilus edulis]
MEPKITLYENKNFRGRSQEITDSCPNLLDFGFNNITSSVKCDRGVWIGYRYPNYDGEQSLFLKGKYTASVKANDEGGFTNDRISSFSKIMVKPSPEGNMTLLQIDYDLERANIVRTPTSVFSWTQVNNTSVEQTVTKTDEVTIQREDTYEFRWDRAAKVSSSISAYVGIPLVGEAEVNISAEMSVSMGINAGTRRSKTETWIAEYPSKIPRYSTVTMTSKLTQGNITIPFTAILCYGNDTERTLTEKGVFYGCQFFDFHTDFNETKLP